MYFTKNNEQNTESRRNMTDKKLLIAGAGVSGKAAARLADFLKMKYDLIDEKPLEGVTIVWDGKPVSGKYHTAVLSPGIRPGSPLLAAVSAASECLAGELAFAAKYVSCPIAAITGTNGKTTATEITTALFQAVGEQAEAAGNIGNGMSDAAISCMEGKIRRLVAEVSSFQMEHAESLKTEVAAVLNLAGDHLDRHGSMEEYERLKWKLAMSAEKAVVLNGMFRGGRWAEITVPVLTFSARLDDTDFTLKNNIIFFRGKEILDLREVKLKGIHNAENIMAAMAITAAAMGEHVLQDERLLNALRDFAPDHHRMEVFLEQNGITCIDDSKATNPHAVNAALDALRNGTEKNVLLLLGGLDKDMVFSELLSHLGCVRTAYLTGQCREKIAAVLDGVCPVILCPDFDETVRKMCRDARPGDTILLSPATASMDIFKNYRERGERFKAICRQEIQ